jgi:exodeoxyribonuclease V alpha subunit
VVELNEIFRQAAESLITVNAHRIRGGMMPESGTKDSDFFILPRAEAEIAPTVVDLIRNRLPASYGDDVTGNVQIITPSRKGSAGTERLNILLQEALNPPEKGRSELKFRDIVFRVGDRIMQTKNDYSVEWETPDGRTGTGIFNGDIGVVLSIDREDRTMKVAFDERICHLDHTALEEVEHAFAITVHKSQGSEYPVVILPVYSCAPMLLNRNLLYTAVTRAARMAILVGQKHILQQMVSSDRQIPRCTMLQKFLAG